MAGKSTNTFQQKHAQKKFDKVINNVIYIMVNKSLAIAKHYMQRY